MRRKITTKESPEIVDKNRQGVEERPILKHMHASKTEAR